jgi:succinyl-CoA synthetase beta subunit
MKLHEYQSKQLFSDYRIPTPKGVLVESVEDAVEAAQQLGGQSWVVKAQVHTRGRGPAGGVSIVKGLEELKKTSGELLNRRLVTKQTGPVGQPIRRLLIEEVVPLERELYLALLVDRSLDRIVVVASGFGGVDIEELALNDPSNVFTVAADLVMGLQHSHARRLALKLGLDKRQEQELAGMIYKLYRLFRDKDLALLEINPIAVTPEGSLIALDARLVVDENALFRQSFLKSFRDEEQEDEKENFAEQHGLRFVSLSGHIGCVVNGAGLAMATTDLIKIQGGEPANFLDIAGNVTEETIVEAVRLITSETDIHGILVNIFGGLVSCEVVARGLITAIEGSNLEIPIVVRFAGNSADEGKAILAETQYRITLEDDLVRSVNAIVDQTQ